MKCEQCNVEFKPKRSTARYCSSKCRKLAFRENGKVSVPSLSVLPPDVVRYIDNISTTLEEHKRRTAAAKTYQRTFPGRAHTLDRSFTIKMAQAGKKNLPVSLPGDDDYEGVCLDPKYDSRRIA